MTDIPVNFSGIFHRILQLQLLLFLATNDTNLHKWKKIKSKIQKVKNTRLVVFLYLCFFIRVYSCNSWLTNLYVANYLYRVRALPITNRWTSLVPS